MLGRPAGVPGLERAGRGQTGAVLVRAERDAGTLQGVSSRLVLAAAVSHCANLTMFLMIINKAFYDLEF